VKEQRPREIMRRGSTTFFNSSLFFPKQVRADVVTLYAFVRTADDYVDRRPQDRDGFRAFRDEFRAAEQGRTVDSRVVADFVALSLRCGFERDWTHDFLDAMEQDLWKREYATLAETEEYMRGSAESVGFMMARVMRLPDASLPYAGLLGKAFQYLNFIRDAKEDLELNRVYIPREDIAESRLPELSLSAAIEYPDLFAKLIRGQLARYRDWRREAAEGYKLIPGRYLIAIKTASDVFDLTAAEIDADPRVVLNRKVKPSRGRVLFVGVRNLLAVRVTALRSGAGLPATTGGTEE